MNEYDVTLLEASTHAQTLDCDEVEDICIQEEPFRQAEFDQLEPSILDDSPVIEIPSEAVMIDVNNFSSSFYELVDLKSVCSTQVISGNSFPTDGEILILPQSSAKFSLKNICIWSGIFLALCLILLVFIIGRSVPERAQSKLLQSQLPIISVSQGCDVSARAISLLQSVQEIVGSKVEINIIPISIQKFEVNFSTSPIFGKKSTTVVLDDVRFSFSDERSIVCAPTLTSNEDWSDILLAVEPSPRLSAHHDIHLEVTVSDSTPGLFHVTFSRHFLSSFTVIEATFSNGLVIDSVMAVKDYPWDNIVLDSSLGNSLSMIKLNTLDKTITNLLSTIESTVSVSISASSETFIISLSDGDFSEQLVLNNLAFLNQELVEFKLALSTQLWNNLILQIIPNARVVAIKSKVEQLLPFESEISTTVDQVNPSTFLITGSVSEFAETLTIDPVFLNELVIDFLVLLDSQDWVIETVNYVKHKTEFEVVKGFIDSFDRSDDLVVTVTKSATDYTIHAGGDGYFALLPIAFSRIHFPPTQLYNTLSYLNVQDWSSVLLEIVPNARVVALQHRVDELLSFSEHSDVNAVVEQIGSDFYTSVSIGIFVVIGDPFTNLFFPNSRLIDLLFLLQSHDWENQWLEIVDLIEIDPFTYTFNKIIDSYGRPEGSLIEMGMEEDEDEFYSIIISVDGYSDSLAISILSFPNVLTASALSLLLYETSWYPRLTLDINPQYTFVQESLDNILEMFVEQGLLLEGSVVEIEPLVFLVTVMDGTIEESIVLRDLIFENQEAIFYLLEIQKLDWSNLLLQAKPYIHYNVLGRSWKENTRIEAVNNLVSTIPLPEDHSFRAYSCMQAFCIDAVYNFDFFETLELSNIVFPNAEVIDWLQSLVNDGAWDVKLEVRPNARHYAVKNYIEQVLIHSSPVPDGLTYTVEYLENHEYRISANLGSFSAEIVVWYNYFVNRDAADAGISLLHLDGTYLYTGQSTRQQVVGQAVGQILFQMEGIVFNIDPQPSNYCSPPVYSNSECFSVHIIDISGEEVYVSLLFYF
ncbi:hypothetical protein RCL1_008352 [Eukaryota sp. TZLM3-RCL]